MKGIWTPKEQKRLYKKLSSAGFDVNYYNDTELKVSLNRSINFLEVKSVIGNYKSNIYQHKNIRFIIVKN